METPLGPADSLREHERAAALPYTEYPPTPRWYPPAVGVWAAVFLGSFLYLWSEPAFGFAMFALIAVELGFISWYRRKRGTMPSMKGAPTEFNRAFRLYAAGLVGLAVVIAAATLVLPHIVAVAVCFVGVTGGLAAYERVYREAADATRARLR